jgi:hypothetical protein
MLYKFSKMLANVALPTSSKVSMVGIVALQTVGVGPCATLATGFGRYHILVSFVFQLCKLAVAF